MSGKDKKLLITFGLDEKENQFIESIESKEFSIEHIVVDDSMTGMKIKDIAGGKRTKTSSIKLPEEKVILFDNVEKDELTGLMETIKDGFRVRPIFAVVTETSANWTFDYLIDQLVQEKEWFAKQQDNKRG